MGLNKNHKVQEYINSVCVQIKNRRAHKEIQIELLGHIEETSLEYLATGATEDEAAERAIKQMGNAELVGRQLNKIHKTQPEWIILLITILFASFGLLVMYFIDIKGTLYSNIHVFKKSLVFTIVGITMMVGLYFVDYRKIQPFSKYIYAGTVLILLFVVYCSIPVNGARRWLSIGPFSINFVDISPILFIIALSGLFENWNWTNPKKIIYGLVLSVVPVFIILEAPSFSTSVVYLIAVTILVIVSGIKLKHLLLTFGFGVAIFLFNCITQPYRLDRFLDYISPDSYGSGWMVNQSIKLIHSAGLFGNGFTFNPNMLENVNTSFVFAYIVYTFGWIVAIIMATLVVIFLIRIACVAMTVKNNYAKLLASGFVGVFAVQFVWNILINLGLAPAGGVQLPFISYGGSQFIASMLEVGIITSIYKWRNVSYLSTESKNI